MGNKWIEAMAKARKENPSIKDFKKIVVIAKKTYKPIKK
jgi:hypothetical protein